METRIFQLKLSHAFNIFHGTSPSYLQENFLKVCDNHGYNTRSSLYNFSQPSIKEAESTSFYYNAICDWNGLPESVKGCKKIGEYKKTCENHSDGMQLKQGIKFFCIFLNLNYFQCMID